MLFHDRIDAGYRLAKALQAYQGRSPLVLAIPRGAVPMGRVLADELRGDLDVVLVRKIGMPGNRELALGAIAGPEGGTMVLNEALVHAFGIEPEVIEAQAAPERVELARRRKLWGAGLAPGALKGKRVILVDDGIATGATMRAAIGAVRAEAPAEVIVAVPVAAPDTLDEMRRLADRVVCLAAPEGFTAVGLHYASFPQLEDADVQAILAARPEGGPTG